MDKIVALDPGKTVGWASLSDDGYHAGQFESVHIWKWLNALEPRMLVVERYIHRAKFHVDLEAVEVIGIIKEWCRQYYVPSKWQMPTQVKHFFTDARLKERELFMAGNPHANDAMRHLLYYTDFTKGKNLGKEDSSNGGS